jgi:hypothetical protein
MRSLALTLALITVARSSEPSAVLSDYGARAPTPEQVAPQPVPPQPADAVGARKRAAVWLLEHQHADGGWSSGNHGTTGADAPSDVATTAFAVMALSRDAGMKSTHDVAIDKGVRFVVNAVETAPPGPKLATPEGTQIQYKLGQLVDTHLASLMLTEVLPKLEGDLQRRAKVALQKVVDKVEAAQNADGSFDANAWAPVLSDAIAAQSLSGAANLGIDVDEKVLAKSDEYQAAQGAGGSFDTSKGAGVKLYAVASGMRSNDVAAQRVAAAPAAEVKAKAEAAEREAVASVRAETTEIIAGYGSIGGEEMLSYMMISDTLAAKGGKEYADWQTQIGKTLASAQNADGSWVGHHCITSQAFATAGGVMVLTAGEHAAIASKIRG